VCGAALLRGLLNPSHVVRGGAAVPDGLDLDPPIEDGGTKRPALL
jgi:hypothetical protein